MARPVRRTLSAARIHKAAFAIADRRGLEAVTMRRVAQRLGVEAMSLYHHVPDKDALLDGLVERIVEQMALPPPDMEWRAAMRVRARSADEVLRRHPWSLVLLVSRADLGPQRLAHVEATLACLRRAGFSWALADHAWNALDSYVFGFALQKSHFPIAPPDYGKRAQDALAAIPLHRYPNINGLANEVIHGRHDGINLLDLGLDLLLEGLEALRG